MHKGYFQLFKEIAHGAASVAEQTLEYDKKNGDLAGYSNAKKMRDNYLEIKHKAELNKNFSKDDWRNLYIASLIIIESIKGNIEKNQAVMEKYRDDLMPKIKQICDDEENWESLVDDLFEISESNS